MLDVFQHKKSQTKMIGYHNRHRLGNQAFSLEVVGDLGASQGDQGFGSFAGIGSVANFVGIGSAGGIRGIEGIEDVDVPIDLEGPGVNVKKNTNVFGGSVGLSKGK